jgi:hypothetical protein
LAAGGARSPGNKPWIALIQMSARVQMSALATRPEGASRYFVQDVPPRFIFLSRYFPARVGRFACFDAYAEELSGAIEAVSVDRFYHIANVS